MGIPITIDWDSIVLKRGRWFLECLCCTFGGRTLGWDDLVWYLSVYWFGFCSGLRLRRVDMLEDFLAGGEVPCCKLFRCDWMGRWVGWFDIPLLWEYAFDFDLDLDGEGLLDWLWVCHFSVVLSLGVGGGSISSIPFLLLLLRFLSSRYVVKVSGLIGDRGCGFLYLRGLLFLFLFLRLCWGLCL